MAWRIYRLPGSRLVWHLDTGHGTQIVNVRGFQTFTPCYSVDDEAKHPRAWIEIPSSWTYEPEFGRNETGPVVHETQLHIVDGIAVWTTKPEVKDTESCAVVVAEHSA